MVSLFSRVLMAVLTSNVMIILAALILCHSRLMLRVGYRVLIVLTCLILFRCILVVEFPSTENVILPELLSKWISWLMLTRCRLCGLKVSLWSLLFGVWLYGAIFRILKYGKEWYDTRLNLLRCGRNLTDTEPYSSLIRRICVESHRRNPFQVIEAKGVSVPCLFGIWKPCILLPPLQLSEGELELLLRHEIFHHFSHDLLFKQIVTLLTMVYWWNPVGKLLRRQTDIILDMRIDSKLVGQDPQLKNSYLCCLIKVAEGSIQEEEIDSAYLVSISGRTNDLYKRFEMLINRERHNRFLSAPVIIGSIFLTIASYMFILEASYIPKSEKESFIWLDSEDDYAVRDTDGTYDIYLHGYYIETVDSLEYYPHNMQVYEKGELTNEN